MNTKPFYWKSRTCRTRWWLRNCVLGVRYFARAMRDDPRIPICGFCHRRPLFADDIGWSMLWPVADDGRFTCRACLDGAPGHAHRARYGEGDR